MCGSVVSGGAAQDAHVAVEGVHGHFRAAFADAYLRKLVYLVDSLISLAFGDDSRLDWRRLGVEVRVQPAVERLHLEIGGERARHREHDAAVHRAEYRVAAR